MLFPSLQISLLIKLFLASPFQNSCKHGFLIPLKCISLAKLERVYLQGALHEYKKLSFSLIVLQITLAW